MAPRRAAGYMRLVPLALVAAALSSVFSALTAFVGPARSPGRPLASRWASGQEPTPEPKPKAPPKKEAKAEAKPPPPPPPKVEVKPAPPPPPPPPKKAEKKVEAKPPPPPPPPPAPAPKPAKKIDAASMFKQGLKKTKVRNDALANVRKRWLRSDLEQIARTLGVPSAEKMTDLELASLTLSAVDSIEPLQMRLGAALTRIDDLETRLDASEKKATELGAVLKEISEMVGVGSFAGLPIFANFMSEEDMLRETKKAIAELVKPKPETN